MSVLVRSGAGCPRTSPAEKTEGGRCEQNGNADALSPPSLHLALADCCQCTARRQLMRPLAPRGVQSTVIARSPPRGLARGAQVK